MCQANYYLLKEKGLDQKGELREIVEHLRDKNGNDVTEHEMDMSDGWDKPIKNPLGPYDIGEHYDVRKVGKLYLPVPKRQRLTDMLNCTWLGSPVFFTPHVIKTFRDHGVRWDPDVAEVPVDVIDKKDKHLRGEYIMLWPPRKWDIFDREKTSYFQGHEGIDGLKPGTLFQKEYTKKFDIVVDRKKIPPYDLFCSVIFSFWVVNEKVKELVEAHDFTNFDFEAFDRYI